MRSIINYHNQIESDHEGVELEDGKEMVVIDKALAPLIVELWEMDHITQACCQGDNDWKFHPPNQSSGGAYILFQEPEHATEFSDILKQMNEEHVLDISDDPNYAGHKRGCVRFPMTRIDLIVEAVRQVLIDREDFDPSCSICGGFDC